MSELALAEDIPLGTRLAQNVGGSVTSVIDTTREIAKVGGYVSNSLSRILANLSYTLSFNPRLAFGLGFAFLFAVLGVDE